MFLRVHTKMGLETPSSAQQPLARPGLCKNVFICLQLFLQQLLMYLLLHCSARRQIAHNKRLGDKEKLC